MKLSCIIFWCFIFLSYHDFIISSLVEGTLVKTPRGLVLVEELKVGDMVISFDAQNKLKELPILCITKDIMQVRLIVSTEQEAIITSEDQFFYTDTHLWVPANNITDDYALYDCNAQLHQCGKIIRVCAQTTVYRITIGFPHIIFISESQLATYI